mgnify:CR=1 FL=1
MILSVSRRTDIPACYAEWFFNRVQEKFALVRNPRNFHQVSRVRLEPAVVDGIVFWTKNPIPMLNRLEELSEYTYYFQFTLTPYGRELEPGLPDKPSVLIPAFQQLSRQIGAESSGAMTRFCSAGGTQWNIISGRSGKSQRSCTPIPGG